MNHASNVAHLRKTASIYGKTILQGIPGSIGVSIRMQTVECPKGNSISAIHDVSQPQNRTIADGEEFTLTFYASTTWDSLDTAFNYSLIYGNTSQEMSTDDFYWEPDVNDNLRGNFLEFTLTGTATASMDGTKAGIMFTPFKGTNGSFPVIDDVSLAVVPEPSSLALLGLSSLLVALRRRRR